VLATQARGSHAVRGDDSTIRSCLLLASAVTPDPRLCLHVAPQAANRVNRHSQGPTAAGQNQVEMSRYRSSKATEAKNCKILGYPPHYIVQVSIEQHDIPPKTGKVDRRQSEECPATLQPVGIECSKGCRIEK